mgnify:FL=1
MRLLLSVSRRKFFYEKFFLLKHTPSIIKMSSASIVASINYCSIQISNYLGISTVILGVLGGIFNMIVFLSLRIFRESSCGIYLIVMSCVHIFQLAFGYFYRILTVGSLAPWLDVSILSCTVRMYLSQICGVISVSCICLAVIDQYLATPKYPRLQQWSQAKVNKRICVLMCLFWILLCSPHLIYLKPVYSSLTNATICTIINPTYQNYFNRVYMPVISYAMIHSTNAIFAVLAYQNVQEISYRTVPLVRRQHEVQITRMILIQTLIGVSISLPYFIISVLTNNIRFTNDPVILAKIQLTLSVALWMNFVYFAVSLF